MEKLLKAYMILGLVPILAGMVYLKSYPSDFHSDSLAAGQLFTDEIKNLSSIKKMQSLSYLESRNEDPS